MGDPTVFYNFHSAQPCLGQRFLGGGESIRELQRESFVHKTSGFGVVFDATLKQKRLLVALKASQPPQLFG